MSSERFQKLRQVYATAATRAPALARRLADAGLTVGDLGTIEELSRLPVLKKERLLADQRANPPFGGYLACDPSEMARIYVSPGPIYEPSLRSSGTGHGMDALMRAAGIGPGDIALNTWSYHLVPAGLLFDEGLQAVGATVVPGGVGNSDQQADVIIELGVTVVLASTAFFLTLAEAIEAKGRPLPAGWKVRAALLGGELGDWMGKRRRIEARFGIETWATYATADFGLIAHETRGDQGYKVHPDRIVQICDPITGMPLPDGETGEIVVTTLAPGWPLIRFGTGDTSYALETLVDGGVGRIAALQGRVGEAVKAREIFIYPRQVEETVIATPGVVRAQVVVSRPGHREEILLRLEIDPSADEKAISALAAGEFQRRSRLRCDRVECVGPNAWPETFRFVVDQKTG